MLPFREARPLNLLNIALFRLASSYLHPCPYCSRLGSRALVPSILAPCVYMERPKKQASRQAKKQTNEIGKACKEQASKGAKQGQTNM